MNNILFLTSPAPLKAGFSTGEKRPPLGLGSIMSIVRECGKHISFQDQYVKPSSLENVNNIDMIGIYTNTICYNGTLEILEKLKGYQGTIVLGGPHTSIDTNNIPDNVNYIVQGEGEISILDIINNKATERIIIGKKINNLDDLPMPTWDLFVKQPYNWKVNWLPNVQPIFTMNTSRGCPFNCLFCSVGKFWGKEYRALTAEKVINDIEFLMQHYGAKGIYFREDNFTHDKNRTMKFCELLLKKNLNIPWLCESRVDSLLDSELVNLMAKAGCKVLFIGAESGSSTMLKFLKKGITVEQTIKAFDNVHRANIKTYASFIVGVPNETQQDVKDTEKLIHQIKPNYVGKNVFLGMPGSKLYDYLEDNHLYEYRDNLNILYPIGFLDNVKKYYNNNSNFLVYTEEDKLI